MRHIASALALSALLFSLSACSDIAEHEVDVVLDYDGTRFHGVIRFPSHDDEWNGGDDSCSFYSGNCGERSTTVGELVSGDLPLESAVLEGDGEFYSYDIHPRRSPSDQAAVDEALRDDQWRPVHPFTCVVYSSTLGERAECYGTTKPVALMLTRRD